MKRVKAVSLYKLHLLNALYSNMSGLEVPGLEETLGLLLDMAVAVHSRCATSTEALLAMLDTGDLTHVSLAGDEAASVIALSSVSSSYLACTPSQSHMPVFALSFEPRGGLRCPFLGLLNPHPALQALQGRHAR